MYHLFISYSSKDRAWAERLYDGLLSSFPTLNIFWDRESLKPGEDFRKQLRDGTMQTAHLVALWSKNAEASQEVVYEIAAYEAQSQKQIFYLPLDSTHSPSNYLQGFMSVFEARAYNGADADLGTAAIDADPIFLRNWKRNIRQLGDALLETEKNTQPIVLAVLAMQASWLPDLQRPNRLGPLHHVDHYLAAIGLSYSDLSERYGATAFEWEPFGDGANVIEFVENLRVRTNATLGPNQFHWKPMDLLREFLALPDEAALKKKMEELSAQPSVVVVDPISLYHDDVKTVFLRLSEYVSRENATVVSFSPVHRRGVDILYDALRRRGSPLLDPWFEPAIPPTTTFAKCGINLDSLAEFDRLVRGRLGMLAAERRLEDARRTTGWGMSS
jgi:hypothetical protein